MRTTWILTEMNGAWLSFPWRHGKDNWYMCRSQLAQFFPKLRGKKKARLKITRTRHTRSIKLELQINSVYGNVWVYRHSFYYSSKLLDTPSDRLKKMYPRLAYDCDGSVTVYVSITPID